MQSLAPTGLSEPASHCFSEAWTEINTIDFRVHLACGKVPEHGRQNRGNEESEQEAWQHGKCRSCQDCCCSGHPKHRVVDHCEEVFLFARKVALILASDTEQTLKKRADRATDDQRPDACQDKHSDGGRGVRLQKFHVFLLYRTMRLLTN